MKGNRGFAQEVLFGWVGCNVNSGLVLLLLIETRSILVVFIWLWINSKGWGKTWQGFSAFDSTLFFFLTIFEKSLQLIDKTTGLNSASSACVS